MKTNHRQIGWHILLCIIVFLLLMPIIFAVSNSFKTLTDAFNTVFQVIPLHPTLDMKVNLDAMVVLDAALRSARSGKLELAGSEVWTIGS